MHNSIVKWQLDGLQADTWSTFSCRGSQDSGQLPQSKSSGCHRLPPDDARDPSRLCAYPIPGQLCYATPYRLCRFARSADG